MTTEMPQSAICQFCESEFKPVRVEQKFCPSPAQCKKAFWREVYYGKRPHPDASTA